MIACPDRSIQVRALLDGELDPVAAAAARAHLNTCEGCNAEFQRLQGLHARPQPDGAAPRPLRTAAPWAGGGLIGAAAAGLLVFLIQPTFTSDGGLERQLIASHVHSLLADHLTDVATSDPQVVRPWFYGKVAFAPPAPELAGQGFPLVGGRLDYIGGRVTPAVVYRRRLHAVNLFVWPAGSELFAHDKTERRDGYSLAEWTRGGLRFAAVSDIDPGELEQFRKAFVARSPS